MLKVWKNGNKSFPVSIQFNDSIKVLTEKASKELEKELHEVNLILEEEFGKSLTQICSKETGGLKK